MPDKPNEDISCPICNTDVYLNPNMFLLVNLKCYHKLCEACINRLFTAGSNACPTCQKTQLRKTDFVKPTFENAQVERECRIRKRIQKIYNSRLEDFNGDLRLFNDYLEHIEDVVFNLLNDVDVESTNAEIEQYALENAQMIQRNHEKRQMEDSMIKQILQDERNDYHQRKALDSQVVEEETIERQRKKKEIIDQLAASTLGASKIVDMIENESADITATEQLETLPEDGNNRGPSLMQRLEQYKLNMVRVQEAEKSTVNPFENVSSSDFQRLESPLILPSYLNSCIEPVFDSVKFKAGGYSQRQVYKKALESIYLSIQV